MLRTIASIVPLTFIGLLPQSGAGQERANVPSNDDSVGESRPEKPLGKTPERFSGTQITRNLWASTVTVRVTPAPSRDRALRDPLEEKDAEKDTEKGAGARGEQQARTATPDVRVFSGAVIGPQLVVTFSQAEAGARYRITLPDGHETDGQLRVVDLFTGLSLLEWGDPIERKDAAQNIPALPLAERLPEVGSEIYSAAAAGIEKPVVSRGMLSQVERVLSGTGLPPLLQCDLRTTDTSAGAAVVDDRGRLIGVIAVTTSPEKGSSWPYAVPVRHVLRLLNARSGKNLVILRQRQLARLGLTLFTPGDEEHKDEVRVERVAGGGPAAEAGLKKGDVILQCDGVNVSYVYQVTSMVRKKFPGDAMRFRVKQGEKTSEVKVTLGGGAVVRPDQLVNITGPLYVQQMTGARDGRNFRVRSGVPVPLEAPVDAAQQPLEPTADPHDPLALLGKQVQAFAAVIEKLRQDLRRRDAMLELYRREMEVLREELKSLKREKKE